MPEPARMPYVERQINDVRRQLLDAAAFAKLLSPEALEHMAGTLADGLRVLSEERQVGMRPRSGPPTHAACLHYRRGR
ncbi:DUF6374 family protein [Nocardia sp. NPDC020380]|uniref:DUF6374 family protein n=1 Tax=Nocardia sp. NPDC020380 TaxID=3364309 RepID=UPI00378EF65A